VGFLQTAIGSQAAKARGRPQLSAFTHLPAPIGGWNAADALSGMSPSDCVFLYNMIPFQYGLRTRLGWREWATGLDGDVRTILPFNGSAVDGSGDRLFVTTSSGIWDVTNSTATPTQVYVFSANNSVSGKGVSTSFANLAGHFLAYADEADGYVLYSELTDTWQRIAQAATTVWTTGTVYNPGDQVSSNGATYLTTLGGTAGATAPSGGGTGINDGGVLWDFVPTVSGVDPQTFRHVCQWKNRLWFCGADSSVAYYLDLNAISGPANPLFFGPRFKYGGSLVGLYSWTVDGGTGIDDNLVGISSAGDVVIYQGSDPSLDQTTFPGTFGLKGVWWVGAVPPGRKFVSDFGGDVFILSIQGCVPLSKLVAGGIIRDPNLFATQKIANLFNALMGERRTFQGWELRIHPSDNTLIINVPVTPGADKEQLTMSLATKGWARHRGVPMVCMDSWHGMLFFGTEDGRVCINDGAADGVTLEGIGATDIEWSLLTSFQNIGSARKKMLHFIRPHFLTDGTAPNVAVRAQYDFNLGEIDSSQPYAMPLSAGGLWDTGLWDTAVWGSGADAVSRVGGGVGLGTSVAISLRGSSRSTTTLAGFDCAVEQGGYL
jgi:hypothetical protein